MAKVKKSQRGQDKLDWQVIEFRSQEILAHAI
jgi:hypothetical protein